MQIIIVIMLFFISTSSVFAQAALPSSAFAQTEKPAETYADTDMTSPEDGIEKQAGFHGMVGYGFFTAKRIYGDNHRLINPNPVILMRYGDKAYWSLNGGGLWLAQTPDHSLRFGVGARELAGTIPGIDPYRAGMAQRKGFIDGFVNAVWRTPLVTVGAHYYHDFMKSGDRSDAATLRVSKEFLLGHGLWLIPSIGVEWQSGARVTYYYGVRPEEELPTRPVYSGSSAVNADIGFAGLYRLAHSLSLMGGVFETRYGNSIVESPIVTRRYQTLLFFGAGWCF